MIASAETRKIELILEGKDKASAVFSRASSNLKREAKEMQQAYAGFGGEGLLEKAGVSRKSGGRFSSGEQDVRDTLAGRIRAMRDSARRAQVQAEVNSRLFGSPAGKTQGQLETERFKAAFDAGGIEGAKGGTRGVSAATKRKIREQEENYYKSLKEQTDGLEKASKLIRGIGALGIVGEVGRVLQGVPDTIERFRENLRFGATKTQAFASAFADAIPVIGDLAKGIKATMEAINDARFGKSAEKQIEESKASDQQNRDIRDRLRDAKNAKNGQIIGAGREAGQGAEDSLRLAGLTGDKRSAMEARIALEAKLRDASALEGSARGLSSTDAQDKVKAQAQRVREAAQAEFQDKLNKLDSEAMEKSLAQDEEHRQRIKQSQAQTQQEQLQQQGKFLEAKLSQIRDEYDNEVAEIQKRQLEEQKGMDPNDPRFAQADKRASQALSEADDRQRAKEANVLQQDRIENAKAERAHQNEVLNIRSAAAVERLRVAGREKEAERLELAAQLEQRLQQIKDNLADEISQHAENAPALRKRASEDAAAAREQFDVDVEAASARRDEQFRSRVSSGFTGESRLRTGATGEFQSPQLTETRKQTELVKKSNELIKDQNDKLGQLIAVLGGGGAKVAILPLNG